MDDEIDLYVADDDGYVPLTLIEHERLEEASRLGDEAVDDAVGPGRPERG